MEVEIKHREQIEQPEHEHEHEPEPEHEHEHQLIFDNLCTREEIEELIGFRIRTLILYQEALLHKSAVKLYNMERSNERLEFIGDSVLNLVVARYLYEKYPNENEGFMTKLRTRIVSGKCLSSISKQMNIQKHIRMNNKALKQAWNTNDRILEDTFEALIGAIYLDQGYFQAKQFILNKLEIYIQQEDILKDTNYKDILMRYTQTNGLPLPSYVIKQENGPNHNKSFSIQVLIENNIVGEGSARSKKQAEQKAAFNAIQCIGIV
tara:strand:- start:725 stop:1516 length:792 start_codon:yes stop_codon:yes gene_type:complete